MILYYDLDGVMANFDKKIAEILQTDNIYKWEFVYGSKKFWDSINEHRRAFYHMEMMPGAKALWEATKHLSPHILTALPKSNSSEVDDQKRSWVAENLGYEVPVITCPTNDKPKFCAPGDILIDDRAVNMDAWEERGGVFILHQDAVTTWAKLKELEVI